MELDTGNCKYQRKRLIYWLLEMGKVGIKIAFYIRVG
jgi:hypothetical protein